MQKSDKNVINLILLLIKLNLKYNQKKKETKKYPVSQSVYHSQEK